MINVREMQWSDIKDRNIVRFDNPHVALKQLGNAVKSRVAATIEEAAKKSFLKKQLQVLNVPCELKTPKIADFSGQIRPWYGLICLFFILSCARQKIPSGRKDEIVFFIPSSNVP